AERDAAVSADEMLGEEFELPHQLLEVEGDLVRHIRVGRQGLTAALQQLDQRNGLVVERGVLARWRGAEVRLQRDVAKILQRENPELVGVAEDFRHRQRDALQQRGDVRKRQRGEVYRSRVQRQHD